MKNLPDKETARFSSQTAEFDPVKAIERTHSPSKENGWSNTKKTLVITAVVVGVAAPTFLLIKYYKKCVRYEDNCDPFYNEFCQCAEYKEWK